MRLTTLLALAVALSLSACPDDPTTTPDAADTGDTGDTGDTADTADTGDTPDAPHEVIDDGTLDGTRLAGVTVTWPAALELCSTWHEGASLTDELAHKVRITLPANLRPGLTRPALEAATLDAPVVMRSPFSADDHRPSASSSVSRWEVERYDDRDTLLAAVDHAFADLGTLSEHYQVSRLDTPSPVTIATTPGDVSFWWTPVGQQAPHQLVPCDTPDTYELAVESMVVERERVYATIVRFYETRHSEMSADSDDVRPVATQLMSSDRPWTIDQADGFWSHTYAAEAQARHEDTLIDFSRDLGAWQLTFKRLAQGLTINPDSISKIEYLAVQGNSPGSVRVTLLDTEGAPNATTYAVRNPPRRVDASHLAREYGHLCPTPTVGTVGWSDMRAQLVFCPSASGPQGLSLVAVVPIAWRLDPIQAGVPATGPAITALSGRPGWTAAVGSARVEVEPTPDDNFRVEFIDASGTSESSTWGPLSDLVPEEGWNDPIHAASDDDQVEVRIERVWVAQGVGNSGIFAPASVELRRGTRTDRVVTWDTIDYTNTHHNWNDALTATTHDGLTLHWKVDFDLVGSTGLSHMVWVTDADGTILLPETIVHPIPAEN